MAHIAFFHERFLFRFGHDRTMMLHARELVRRGHRVSFVAFEADADTIARIGGKLILLPKAAPSYADLDTFAIEYLRAHWADLFGPGPPDVAVNGGWPFYGAGELFRGLGVTSVFYDAGATPLEGLPPSDLPVHRKLRRLRRAHIGQHDATVSVSQFIARTQTLVDAPEAPNTVVLNAADHLIDPLWTSAENSSRNQRAMAALAEARASGRRVLLHLGRWEGGYKNKQGALEVLRGVVARGHDVAMLTLAEADAGIPSDLSGRVLFAGHPDDETLRHLMRESDAGLSASLWEGFNLPLAEMHFLGRPAFALDVGAHREAAISDIFVCASLDDMAERVATLFEGPPPAVLQGPRLQDYRAKMSWSRAGGELEAVLLDLLARNRPGAFSEAIVVDVTNASRDPANSGVIRVTRQATRELLDLCRCLPVVWDETAGDYRLPFDDEALQLSAFGGPRLEAWQISAGAPVFLAEALAREGLSLARVSFFYPETILDTRVSLIMQWLRDRRVDYSAVLHDMLPLSHPEYCDPGIAKAFPAYVEFLAGARTLIANSQTTAGQWRSHGMREGGPRLVTELLPGAVGHRAGPNPARDGVVRILTVSTLEPRKNHAGLLDAFEAAQKSAPCAMELHLVGNGYEGANSVLTAVKARARANPSIVYHGVVDDEELRALYERADFTVYPSLVEGFGLPVLESLWNRRPVICHQQGSMAELARPGGALTCDAADPESLKGAILDLALNPPLRRTLARAAALRQMRTWREYARACLGHLVGAPVDAERAAGGPQRLDSGRAQDDWESLLYPGKPRDWQMNDSERMTLAGLLARWRPRTYLEIGTYRGGSALLAAEFADWVITIDIDPAAEAFAKADNITFIAGQSQQILPDLLSDLAQRDLYPEFILIDGDHSAEGVRRDVDLILKIRPPRPLLMVMHDSFNPDCRDGMASAVWSSPWAHRLDLDFVPGRVINAGDRFGGEMWGGLAVALLLPEPREGPADIRAPAHEMFEQARQRLYAA